MPLSPQGIRSPVTNWGEGGCWGLVPKPGHVTCSRARLSVSRLLVGQIRPPVAERYVCHEHTAVKIMEIKSPFLAHIHMHERGGV